MFKIKKFGYTLLEIIVVLAIMGILLGAIFGSMASSRQSWQSASDQIDSQQDARRVVDRISWELKSTNPSWQLNTTFYNITVNSAGDRIDFYMPIFYENDTIAALKAVRYSVGGLDNEQMLRREGSDTVVVANNIYNDNAQKPFFSFNNTDNTIVDIKIPTIKNNQIFVLNSQANLRNRQVQLDEEVDIEEITEE